MKSKLLVTVLAAVVVVAGVEAQDSPLFVEALPDRVQARLQVKTRAAANAAQSHEFAVQYFMFFSKRWPDPVTKPITVAFLGGDRPLRDRVAGTAAEWSKYGALKFDFVDPSTGTYREWTRSDTAFKADIRVAFDGVDGPGYWSLVGTDGSDGTVIAPNEASLGLQGFDSKLPLDWQATVFHEFGHALGLMHEHQMPVGGCDQDFKWEDDSGYVPTQDAYGQYIKDSMGHRPGIYTLLAGYPNYWPKDKVDRNMRQLASDSDNYDFSSLDKNSIMKYYLDERLFRDGKSSHCYSDENLAISAEDQVGIAKWYPKSDSKEFKNIQQQQSTLLNALSKTERARSVQSIQSIK